MIYAMLASAILAFVMLGTAKRLPDPYWNILLHLHEAPLASFLFFAIGMFMRSLELPKTIRFRGRDLPTSGKSLLNWKLLLALLCATSAATYRFSAWRAYVAFHDSETFAFNPWLQRGNVFTMTLALFALTIALSHIADSDWRRRTIAAIASTASLLSFSLLLMPAGYPPYHPLTILAVVVLGMVMMRVSRSLQNRWDLF